MEPESIPNWTRIFHPSRNHVRKGTTLRIAMVADLVEYNVLNINRDVLDYEHKTIFQNCARYNSCPSSKDFFAQFYSVRNQYTPLITIWWYYLLAGMLLLQETSYGPVTKIILFCATSYMRPCLQFYYRWGHKSVISVEQEMRGVEAEEGDLEELETVDGG